MKTSQQPQAIPTNRKRQARKPKGLSRLFFFRKSRNPNRENPKGAKKKERKIKNIAMAEFSSLRKAKE
jgi:hypothetical protein